MMLAAKGGISHHAAADGHQIFQRGSAQRMVRFDVTEIMLNELPHEICSKENNTANAFSARFIHSALAEVGRSDAIEKRGALSNKIPERGRDLTRERGQR